MSQHLNEDELAALLPEKTTALQYTISYDESDKNLLDDHSKKHVSFHAISYEITQRRCLKKLMPKVILNNIRYTQVLDFIYVCVHNACNVVLLSNVKYVIFSGIMKTGLNAIMGPSGSGKTT